MAKKKRLWPAAAQNAGNQRRRRLIGRLVGGNAAPVSIKLLAALG
jgi:hypothetical protein